MNVGAGLVLIAIGLFFLFRNTGADEAFRTALVSPFRPASGSVAVEQNLDALYIKHGERWGIDPLLLKAIAQVESSENPNAENPSDPSFGLMQLLCTGSGASCSNALPAVPDWPPETRAQLFDPDYSLHVGAQILKWNQDSFGWLRGIAVYNRWASRLDPPGGPFGNQSYVDKVLSKYDALGGRAPG